MKSLETSIFLSLFFWGGREGYLEGRENIHESKATLYFYGGGDVPMGRLSKQEEEKSVFISLKNVQLFQIMHRLLFAHESNINCIFFLRLLKVAPKCLCFFLFKK